ncbi:MAG: type II toxin-antitoxin system PemK/MazF family toxin [Planctomycetes bacterium]|nr:type II toxin-antitoxin system PemK/MazF family toxin [Planctomycetota bacterium]
MPITFNPHPANILMCDFDSGFKPPEMVKRRPVVVMSKGNGQTVIVIPLSTAEPVPLQSFHVEMSTLSLPESLRDRRCWAKCDMVCTVAYWRLDRVRDIKDPLTGKRRYVTHHALAADMDLIKQALRGLLRL